MGKAIPYGIYDLASNDGFVSVGVDHDTPVFAAKSIEAWWKRVGQARYPNAERAPDQHVTRLALFDPRGCGELRAEAINLDDLARMDDERWANLRDYQALVRRWNRLARHRMRLRDRAHGEREFMTFLFGAASSSQR